MQQEAIRLILLIRGSRIIPTANPRLQIVLLSLCLLSATSATLC